MQHSEAVCTGQHSHILSRLRGKKKKLKKGSNSQSQHSKRGPWPERPQQSLEHPTPGFVYWASVRMERESAGTQGWAEPPGWGRALPVPAGRGTERDPARRTRQRLRRARTVHVIVVPNNKTSCWQKQQRKKTSHASFVLWQVSQKGIVLSHCFPQKEPPSQWLVFANRWRKKNEKKKKIMSSL